MLSRNFAAGAAVPLGQPSIVRQSAAFARPRCITWAAGQPVGRTYVRKPHAQIQKFAQLNQNVHFAPMTRIAPAGGGALGSHQARDPV